MIASLASTLMLPHRAWGDASPTPVILTANQIHGDGTQRWVATGQVKVVYGDRIIYADKAIYHEKGHTIEAQGHVKLVSPGLITHAPQATIHLTTNQGYILKPRYNLLSTKGHGTASRAEELGKGIYRMQQSCFTTCAGGSPAWQLYTQVLNLNQPAGTVSTHNTTLDFFGLPIFWSPYFRFPLRRHSGFLTPNFGTSTINGFDVGIPYYFDIADNLDDTLTLNYYSARGTLLQNQFRYLKPHYSGNLLLDILPDDALTRTTIWAISWQHQQNLGQGWSLNVNYNRVSYAGFLTDFGGSGGLAGSTLGGTTAAAYLPESAGVNYANAHIQAGIGLNAYQLLIPATAPYEQLPHAYLDGYWVPAPRTFAQVTSSLDDFYAPSGVIGQRLNLVPSFGWKLSSGWGFLEPEGRLYYTRYQLQRTTADEPAEIDRTLPALSLAGGLNVVRYGEDGSVDLLQPRFKYLYIPTVNQSAIPNFDASASNMSFPMIFSDNQYSGWDRINGADQVALGLTNTWLTPTGRQLWQLSAGQIRSFSTTQINLSGNVVPSASQSGYFMQGSYAPTTHFNTLFSSEVTSQFNALDNLSWVSQWTPGKGRVFNLDYEYIQGDVDQTGISAAWPVAHRFQILASYQYDVSNHQPLEMLGGIGYDGGCWDAHFYAYHQILLGGQGNDAIYFEIQLRGLTSLGNASKTLLGQYIPGIPGGF